jgi:hypothetical protein
MRVTTFARSLVLLGLVSGCSGAPKPDSENPSPMGPTVEDSLPPDRSPGYDAGNVTTIDSALPLADAPDASADPRDASPGANDASTICHWLRFPGPCLEPSDGNACVPSLYGDAHWELVCHPACATGEVWDGTGCVASF